MGPRHQLCWFSIIPTNECDAYPRWCQLTRPPRTTPQPPSLGLVPAAPCLKFQTPAARNYVQISPSHALLSLSIPPSNCKTQSSLKEVLSLPPAKLFLTSFALPMPALGAPVRCFHEALSFIFRLLATMRGMICSEAFSLQTIAVRLGVKADSVLYPRC